LGTAGPRFADRLREQRTTQILEASLAAFSEEGCFRMTLDQVAQRVGIAKGTIYLHYPSRETLFTAVLTRAADLLREHCWKVWTAAASPAAGMRAVLAELVAMSRRHDAVSPDVLSRLRCSLTWTRLAPADNGVEPPLVSLVRVWQKAGLIRIDVDPLWASRVTLALTAAPSVFEAPTSRNEPVEEVAERIATTLLRGLAPNH